MMGANLNGQDECSVVGDWSRLVYSARVRAAIVAR